MSIRIWYFFVKYPHGMIVGQLFTGRSLGLKVISLDFIVVGIRDALSALFLHYVLLNMEALIDSSDLDILFVFLCVRSVLLLVHQVCLKYSLHHFVTFQCRCSVECGRIQWQP